jgi:hypothetical protein
MIGFGEVERIGEEAVVSHFNVLSAIHLERLSKTTKTTSG